MSGFLYQPGSCFPVPPNAITHTCTHIATVTADTVWIARRRIIPRQTNLWQQFCIVLFNVACFCQQFKVVQLLNSSVAAPARLRQLAVSKPASQPAGRPASQLLPRLKLQLIAVMTPYSHKRPGERIAILSLL